MNTNIATTSFSAAVDSAFDYSPNLKRLAFGIHNQESLAKYANIKDCNDEKQIKLWIKPVCRPTAQEVVSLRLKYPNYEFDEYLCCFELIESCLTIDSEIASSLLKTYAIHQVEYMIEDYNSVVKCIDIRYKEIIDEICNRRKGNTPLIDIDCIELKIINNHGLYVFHDKYKVGLPMGQLEFTDNEWQLITDYIYFKNKGF